MSAPTETLSTALEQLARARKKVARFSGPQVWNREDRDFLKALALSWFNSHRPLAIVGGPPLGEADAAYRCLLDATEKNSAKATYLRALDAAKEALIAARAARLVAQPASSTNDAPPDFSPLAADADMKAILLRRWDECRKCVSANAHLAAVVMMGGLLEALFLSRANRLADKSPLFKASATPKDAKTKKPLPLAEWTLRAYIDVGHELKWITQSAKDVADVVRDYRNYVHPEKERRHGVTLGEHDSAMFWEIVKSLSRQLLRPETSI